jgi:2,5-furandicarboxylate decarboxylase 1
VATRVQADRDVLVIANARAKPLDPSLVIVPGKVPTTAKMGIDATIADDVPRERFHRIAYAYADKVTLEDFLGGSSMAAPPVPDTDIDVLASKIREVIEVEPKYFAELAEMFENDGFQNVARALGTLHEDETLWQDSVGRFCLKNSAFAASPPRA